LKRTAYVNYHVKSHEPQAFLFDLDGIAGNIISPQLAPTKVQVTDLRDETTSVNFERDGIRFDQHKSTVKQFDTDHNWQATYNEELIALLQVSIGAEEVIIFDHTVRIDDPQADRKPARNVHNDYNEAGAHQRLIDIVGPEKAADFAAGHYGFVNVWRPAETTIKSSPLGFIRPSSIQAEDWMTIQLIYPDRVGQILGVAAGTGHDWFYLSDMTPEDVAIFNIYDNKGAPFLAHSALDMDGAKSAAPRKSIESRTLVRYRN